MEKPHKKLDVWQLAMDLAQRIYSMTESFPPRETYSLCDQIRRAAVSVPSNIAEEAAINTKKQFINFLHTAQGSLSELDTQLELAKRLKFVSEEQWQEIDAMMVRVDKMLTGLIRQQRKLIA